MEPQYTLRCDTVAGAGEGAFAATGEEVRRGRSGAAGAGGLQYLVFICLPGLVLGSNTCPYILRTIRNGFFPLGGEIKGEIFSGLGCFWHGLCPEGGYGGAGERCGLGSEVRGDKRKGIFLIASGC